jgi:ElaB/YqjD/DUF883 family membrane-anchored ribosome-binding protein
LHADIAETRSSLADKLEALENRVTDTVETAQAAVEESVEAVRRTLDLKYQVGQRPWVMVGSLVAAGSVVGYFISRRLASPTVRPDRDGARRSAPRVVVDGEPCPRPATEGALALPHHRPPGLFAEEWRKLRGLAVGAGMALIRDWLKEEAPQFADRIDELMNSATAKLGGEVVRCPLLRPSESRETPAPPAGGPPISSD